MRWGLAAAIHGRAWPWLATLYSAAAEQCQDSTAGSGSLGSSTRTVGLGSD